MNDTQIVTLIAEGLSNKEIASELHYSEATIESYRSRLFKRYGAKNGSHLVSIFYQQGKLKPTNGNEKDQGLEKSEIRETSGVVFPQKRRKNYQMELLMLLRRNVHKVISRPKIRKKP